jgi:hypothetical protein
MKGSDYKNEAVARRTRDGFREPLAAKRNRGLQRELYRIFMLIDPTFQQMQSLASAIAREKFAPYRRVFGGDTKQGSQLFLLDGALAGAFHELLRILELTMRESMHRELKNAYGELWMLNQKIFDENTQTTMAIAAKRAAPSQAPERIIAEITLGGWVGLLQHGGFAATDKRTRINYKETLWKPALSRSFANGMPKQEEVAKVAQRIRHLRNRIAHHESLAFGITQTGQRINRLRVKERPAGAFLDICTLAGYLNPDLAAWLSGCKDVELILEHPLMVKAQRFSENISEYHWI